MSLILGVPPAAAREWRELSEALDASSSPMPCQGQQRGLWTGTYAQQQTAAYRCLSCPVFVECGNYARAANEREGTWGGETQSERTKNAQTVNIKKRENAA